MNVSWGIQGYEFTIRGNVVRREVLPWSELPLLEKLKEDVEKATGRMNQAIPSINGENLKQKYNYVVIQLYPNENVGMKPHRDKEVARGTTIAGISLEASRILIISRVRTGKSFRFLLNSGSIYMLRPPTNDFNTHCIEKRDSCESSQSPSDLAPVDSCESSQSPSDLLSHNVGKD